MNPTPEAITKIQDRVQSASGYDFTMGDQQLADAVNSDLVDNPKTADTVPKPFGIAEIMAELDSAAIKTVRSEGNMGDINEAVRANDPERVLNWAAAYLATGDIAQGQYDAIETIVTDTQQDPDYNDQLPWPEVNLGRLVDANDISNARP